MAITVYQIATQLGITDRRILQKAGALMQESDKAKGIKREKIEQEEGKRTYFVNQYPNEMQMQIATAILDSATFIQAQDEIKAERIGEAPDLKDEFERIGAIVPKKRKLVPRIKRPRV